MTIKGQRKSLNFGEIPVFLAIIIFAISAGNARALEIEIQGGMGNLAFEKSKDFQPDIDPDADTDSYYTFEPHLFSFYKFVFSGEAGPNFYYKGGFEQDPILRNRIFADMGIRLDYFVLEAGSFFGIFNEGNDVLNPGIAISVGLEFPEVFFVKLKSSSSLGNNMGFSGSYTQKTSDFQIGIWVPHVRFSFNVENRNFSTRHDGFLFTEDNLTQYFLRSEVFAKNKPYTIVVDIGYQNLGRSYDKQDIIIDEEGVPVLARISRTDELKSVFLGFEGVWTVAAGVKLILGAEMPLFSWSGSKNMKGPGNNTALFEARAGIIWSLPSS